MAGSNSEGNGESGSRFLQLPVELHMIIMEHFYQQREKHNSGDSVSRNDDFTFGSYNDEFDPELNVYATSALAAMCLVSRHVRQIAEPILYSNFRHSEYWGVKGPRSYKKLVCFAWTLHQRPELGRLVRKVHLRDNTGDDWRWRGYYRGRPANCQGFLLAADPCAEHQQKLQDLADRVDDIAISPIYRTWVGKRDPMRRSAILLQLILLKTPNLRELFMDTLMGSWDLSSWTLLQEHVAAARLSATSPGSAFPRLKGLSVRHLLEDKYDWTLHLSTANIRTSHQLSVILGSPNVEHLSFSHCTHVGLLPQFTYLTSISMTSCHLGQSDINQLLESCGKLKSFSYTAASYRYGMRISKHLNSDPDGHIDAFDGHLQATPREIQSALMLHKETLEEIKIGYRFLPPSRHDGTGPFLSWEPFTSLKRLVLQGSGMIHHDNILPVTPNLLSHFLPHNIEELLIHGVFICDLPGFREALVAGRFEKLRKVMFGSTYDSLRAYEYRTHFVTRTSLSAFGIAQVLDGRGVKLQFFQPIMRRP